MVLVVRAQGLFDGVNPGLIHRPTILIEDGRVTKVTSGGDPPRGAETVDLGQATVLPGLVDPHLHLAFDGSDDPVGHLDGLSDEELLEQMREQARLTLASGVTTARDLGDRSYLALRLRDELSADPAGGPQIVASGPPITTTGGHCWFLGGEADSVEDIRQAIRERVSRGADVIKVMASGGEITPGSAGHLAQYGPAELSAAADEAHRHGLPITAHAHAPQSIAEAVAAGFDMVEHCSFLTEDGVDADPAVVAELARRGVTVSLTLGADPDAPPPPRRIAGRIDAFFAGLRTVRQAAVDVVCGSDSGIPHKRHGLHAHSVAMMVDIGFTPLEALRAVTSGAARACGLGDRKGRVAPGVDADLLVVAGDPLTDVTALQEVVAVLRAGTVVRG